MGNPTATRLFDRLLGFLLRPAVRRVRRWSFVVTLPAGIGIGYLLGLRPSVEHGLLIAALLIVLDVVVLIAVASLGTWLLGRERRDALLDLIMHPVARRAIAGEWRVFGVYPRALVARRPKHGVMRVSYHRGSFSLGAAIAMLPAIAAEATVVHLLLPGDWLVVKLALLALTAYSVVMLVGLALAERVYPHELDGATLTLRGGTLYRATIARDTIVSAEQRRERAPRQSGVILESDAARIVARGRTDVVITLSAPVLLERPLGDPVAVTRLSFTADDPGRLLAALAAPPSSPPRTRSRRWLHGLPALDGLELAAG